MAHLPPTTTDLSPVIAGQLQTEFVSFSTRAGLRVAACLDHAGGSTRSRTWVIVTPKYGETKKNSLQLAYQLAANGANVLRFDHTNHVGESEGRMVDFTLPGAVGDILAALDYLTESFGVRSVVAVANSLSARCLLRAAVLDPRITRLISVAGVVNLQATLREVYREDIFGTFLEGRHWGLTDIIGFDINGETFLGTAVAERLHDLAGTLEDMGRLRVPFLQFQGEQDAWVDRREVEQVLAMNPLARLVPVAGAMHEVQENPAAAAAVFQQVTRACLLDSDPPDGTDRPLVAPAKKLVLAQNRRERERLRRSEALPEAETTFWSSYLEKYSILEKSADYRTYLDLLGQLCGPFRPGALVLDAGCGNGMFVRWVLRDLARRQAVLAGAAPLTCVALDLTPSGLADAMAHHLGARPGADPAAPGLQYSVMDFDGLADDGAAAQHLPFRDDTFDVICCSLVLSYLRRPPVLLAELRRVLRPGGVIVVSSIKPHSDLSVIYRDFMAQQVDGEDLDAARNLLRAAGKIKLKEEIGHYTFYSPAQLATLLMDAEFKVRRSQVSLGQQAVVIQAGK